MGEYLKKAQLAGSTQPSRTQGLPDGIFSNQKIPIYIILKRLAKKDVGIFYGHLVYFTAISYMLWQFGIFSGHFGIFFHFWYVVPKKSGNLQ
jgi:hypothetical protein